MSEKKKPAGGPDYSETLFLPQTDFPMRAGLPQKEPELLAREAERPHLVQSRPALG